MEIQPVILCGGAGSRLWPLSRRSHPKQLLSLQNDRSLLQNTLARLHGLPALRSPIVVCNEAYRFLVRQQLRDIGVEDVCLILEPEGKNTAPAIALAAQAVSESAEPPSLLVLPSDHVIEDQSEFHNAVLKAVDLAAIGNLVTFGITAASPETGYGYIERGEEVGGGYRINRFVEKPILKDAEAYLASGQYFWNSGMFVFDAKTYLSKLAVHAPAIEACTKNAWREREVDEVFVRPDASAFSPCPNVSIDYAVMEVEPKAAVVPLDAGWSDIGSWQALWTIAEKDRQGNAVRGDVLIQESQDCYAFADNRLVTLIGLEGVVVVETADSVLVAQASASQRVKDIVDQLETSGREEHIQHRRVYRPWGWYESVDRGPKHHTKRIFVAPGEPLSLQRHEHRAEHWVVVAGTARVTCESKVFELIENESTFIPKGAKHRLENVGTDALEIVEVQSGDYLGEDDITRFEDAYGRSES